MNNTDLLIDVGNTRIKWAIAERRDIVCAGVFNGRPAELEGWVWQLQTAFADQAFDNAYIASVGNAEITALLKRAISSNFKISAREANTKDHITGFSNEYQQIENLGVDRWLAAIGARRFISQGDVLVIDAGTAITIDWLDHHNVFQGGVILPGTQLMLKALIGETAKIKVDLSDKRQIIGKTTSECVNSGIGYGSIGAVEKIIQKMRAAVPRPLQIIVTGGAREELIVGIQDEVLDEGQLVLIGLIDYFENC